MSGSGEDGGDNMNPYHSANRKGWEAVSDSWQANIEEKGLWRRSAKDPSLILAAEELRWLRDVAGRDAAVLGSGDNLIVFALAGMGARVTSVDISQTQLETAARRATDLEIDVRFLCADVTDLQELAADSFDVVYTGGHVAVWVSDLKRYYAEAVRILRPGGLFLVSEYHPFRRPWSADGGRLKMETVYFDRGPFRFDRGPEAGLKDPLPSYEFNWTVGDMVSALVAAGCELLALEEFGEGRESWESVDLSGLPATLLLVGRKRR
ncbi:MAG TPA: class I SAM-dependent methyltransferase [Armatimonadota bacterium]|nr:class I SAM-dependent methyltransferase [Armatimonadota bacterium]